jgi:phosphoribosylanthranilate isomerase
MDSEKSLKLKICGMKFTSNILDVAALKPDYLGFIFYEDTPRNFTGDIPKINPSIKKTGVFVDANLEFIVEKIKEYNLSAVQLHGKESPEFCKELKLKFEELELIKVFSIKDEFDFNKLTQYEGKVDYFLFDTKGKNKGGNGYTFNWELLKDYPSTTPFILSGGIGLTEVDKIIEFQDYLRSIDKAHLLYSLDVNSKFESAPGLKKIEALQSFRENLRTISD